MTKKLFLLAGAASSALASLNCTLTAPLQTHCCPDSSSEVVKTSPAGSLIMIACTADDSNKCGTPSFPPLR